MSLHNEERPQDFSYLVQQDSIKKTLSAQLISGKIKGAYLFSGVRGTGKTTMARIFSSSLNCEHPAADGSPCGCCQSCLEAKNDSNLDIYELDAASNNSVDDIHTILEHVQFRPIHKRKVFILDEVHMLSKSAFNALLKTLEEPPENVVFILCTTEKHMVPATIISRCMCFDFFKISRENISTRLISVCEKRGISIEKSAADIIAKAADGSMRDAYSILDRFMETKNIDADSVSEALGLTSDDAIFQILNAISEKNPVSAVAAVRAVIERGDSLPLFIEDTIGTLLDMIDFQSIGDISGIIGSDEYKDNIFQLSYKMDSNTAFRIMDSFRELYRLKGEAEFMIVSSIVSIIFETSELIELKQEVAELKSKLCDLEKKGNSVSSNEIVLAANVGTESDQKCISSSDIEHAEENALSNNIPTTVASSGNTICDETEQELSPKDYDAAFVFEEELPNQWTSTEAEPLEEECFVPATNSIPFDEFMRSEETASDHSSMMDTNIKTINSESTVSETVQDLKEETPEASWENDFFPDEFARLLYH